ncbi:MAG: SIMPL domain-containing protein [Burkholderiaceae bacterium]
MNARSALLLGLSIALGLAAAAWMHARGALEARMLDRSVTVKGLAEREVAADVVIWPIRFTAADNELEALYERLQADTAKVEKFLLAAGIERTAISTAPPAVTDKFAQAYGSGETASLRFVANRSVTVHTNRIEAVQKAMQNALELGRQGVTLSGDFDSRPLYLYTKLNELKPGMVESATKEARAVARKFADDSDSRLGKIRRAWQGQFSIEDRDQNNPQIKRVRVVSTIEYYLSD